jgi:DNA invertase Pin-like site-specific DNA recombinase
LTAWRALSGIYAIVDRLQAKGVALRILNMNLDTNNATGKLMLQIVGSIAEFERSIILSRQLECIAKVKAEGKYRGGIPTARGWRSGLTGLSVMAILLSHMRLRTP